MVESLPEILTKRRSQTFCKPVDIHSVTIATREYFFNNHTVNQLGKYDFSCGSVVNSLKERQLFSDQMNRNRFNLILARRYWNCSTIENLRCLNSVVNEIL